MPHSELPKNTNFHRFNYQEEKSIRLHIRRYAPRKEKYCSAICTKRTGAVANLQKVSMRPAATKKSTDCRDKAQRKWGHLGHEFQMLSRGIQPDMKTNKQTPGKVFCAKCRSWPTHDTIKRPCQPVEFSTLTAGKSNKAKSVLVRPFPEQWKKFKKCKLTGGYAEHVQMTEQEKKWRGLPCNTECTLMARRIRWGTWGLHGGRQDDQEQFARN